MTGAGAEREGRRRVRLKKDKVMAYHFVGATLRDGRPVPPDGKWLVHRGEVVMCECGLHASRRPWHALQYAPGPVLCEVEIGPVVAEEADKLVTRRRKIVRRFDATDLLRQFARDEAWRVLHLWEAPEVVRRYLETGDETIRDAAGDAAWAAARDAAWAAARDAAWAAARDAAWAAARDAAWAAAWDAAWDAAGERFDALVMRAFAGKDGAA